MMIKINNDKNRSRDEYSFANINLLGKCNVNCFFCLGKDIKHLLTKHNQQKDHFDSWLNFEEFLNRAKSNGIKKIYITGQNTDSLLYDHLQELIGYLYTNGFYVGLRTNGYLAPDRMDCINACNQSAGFSMHTLNPITNKMIMGRKDLPDWKVILNDAERPRVAIVLNRCNKFEFYDILKYLTQFKNIRYVQVRRISTDTRQELLAPDQLAYEEVYTQVSQIFPMTRKFVTDAEEYDIFGLPVVFWRTIKTSINSMNYFTDGTISDKYFVVEGYLENYEKSSRK